MFAVLTPSAKNATIYLPQKFLTLQYLLFVYDIYIPCVQYLHSLLPRTTFMVLHTNIHTLFFFKHNITKNSNAGKSFKVEVTLYLGQEVTLKRCPWEVYELHTKKCMLNWHFASPTVGTLFWPIPLTHPFDLPHWPTPLTYPIDPPHCPAPLSPPH